MKENRSQLIQAKVTPSIKAKIKRYAEENDITESLTIQKACKFFLTRATRYNKITKEQRGAEVLHADEY